MRYVFLGPPGVGKGTQAAMLSQERGIPHIATGDILRQELKGKTAIGLKAKGFMNTGTLVPDEVIVEMAHKRLQQSDCQKGFILDGFPRTLRQAKALDEHLQQHSLKLDRVVCFTSSQRVLVERIVGRRVCSSCGENFHIRNRPSRKAGMCDRCGGALIQRADDNETTVIERLDVYEKQTAPLVSYYEQKGLLGKVSAEGKSEDIQRALEQALFGEKS